MAASGQFLMAIDTWWKEPKQVALTDINGGSQAHYNQRNGNWL